jgi:hypothetical protein
VTAFEPRLERRRDRRHALSGFAILRTRTWTGSEVFGGLVDVSAGGARLRVKPGTGLVPGRLFAVDLEVTMPTSEPSTPPLRLYGRGTVVRVDATSDRGLEACVRFEAPLMIAEGFRPPIAGGRPTVSAEALN